MLSKLCLCISLIDRPNIDKSNILYIVYYMKKDFFGFTRTDLREEMKKQGIKAFVGDILYKWVYEKSIYNTEQMTDISKNDRIVIDELFTFQPPFMIFKARSKLDKTKKYAFQMDNDIIESVIIPDRNRITQCISSQTGCALACKFCATGRKPGRDLTPGEIVQQHIALRDDIKKRITNVVFMGMGEPLLNIENVLQAIEILNDEKGLRIGARKIAVSTAGIIPGIEKLIEFPLQVKLAVSLNSAIQEKREELMPIGKTYVLKELKYELMKYQRIKNKRITFEYILIPGFNNGKEDIDALFDFLSDIDSKINIIPYNTVQGLDFREPTDSEINEFKDQLYPLRDAVSIRKSKGRDISGACGQLKGILDSD